MELLEREYSLSGIFCQEGKLLRMVVADELALVLLWGCLFIITASLLAKVQLCRLADVIRIVASFYERPPPSGELNSWQTVPSSFRARRAELLGVSQNRRIAVVYDHRALFFEGANNLHLKSIRAFFQEVTTSNKRRRALARTKTYQKWRRKIMRPLRSFSTVRRKFSVALSGKKVKAQSSVVGQVLRTSDSPRGLRTLPRSRSSRTWTPSIGRIPFLRGSGSLFAQHRNSAGAVWSRHGTGLIITPEKSHTFTHFSHMSCTHARNHPVAYTGGMRCNKNVGRVTKMVNFCLTKVGGCI